MNVVSMDLGKYKSYGIVKKGGHIVKEGKFGTTMEGVSSFLEGVKDADVIVEASFTVERVASFIERMRNGKSLRMRVVNPLKARIISESMKKTDKNDAHTNLDLFEKDYFPESYLPAKKIRGARDVCRTRAFLVRLRTSLKNRIRDMAYRSGTDFRYFNAANVAMLKEANSMLETMCLQLESLDRQISTVDAEIRSIADGDPSAMLIDTIPGIGKYLALAISSEIGDIDRFQKEDNLFAYAGLVPRLYQSGNREWKGHITKGSGYLKWLLVECTTIHVKSADSSITEDYNRISLRAGKKKAKIAAARRILRAVYYMLKRKQDFASYERERRCVVIKRAALQRFKD